MWKRLRGCILSSLLTMQNPRGENIGLAYRLGYM
jgi:hypothetical protein